MFLHGLDRLFFVSFMGFNKSVKRKEEFQAPFYVGYVVVTTSEWINVAHSFWETNASFENTTVASTKKYLKKLNDFV